MGSNRSHLAFPSIFTLKIAPRLAPKKEEYSLFEMRGKNTSIIETSNCMQALFKYKLQHLTYGM
jgi:hypothetical protein